MTQRVAVRLAVVLALVLGGAWALMSPLDPELPFLVQVIGGWLLNAALLFVVLWAVLAGLAWATGAARRAS